MDRGLPDISRPGGSAQFRLLAGCIEFFRVLSFAAPPGGGNRLTHHRLAHRHYMLVISRKIGESLVIDGDITVTVVKVAGGGVRLGIEAPSGYVIMRNELHDAAQDQSEAAPTPSENSSNQRGTST